MAGRGREREISILCKRVRLQEQALSTPTEPRGPVSQMTTLSINMDEESHSAAASGSSGVRPPLVTVAAPTHSVCARINPLS